MPVSFFDLQLAFEFANFEGGYVHQAFVCRETGKTYCYSEFSENDDSDELPDDIEENEKYVPLPDRRELGLGKPLVLDFARQVLPGAFDEIRNIFSRRGAYRKFRELLIRKGALDRWHDFQNKAEEKALRQWCAENSIELTD